MLGRKRNKSVFISDREELEKVAETDKETPNQLKEIDKAREDKKPKKQYSIDSKEIQNKDKTIDIEEDNPSWKVERELGPDSRSHSLFFTPESEGRDFSSVLKNVQEYISNNYSILITDETIEDSKEHLKRYISKYIQDERISVRGMGGDELIEDRKSVV